jgi:hypothetical protein
VLREEEWRREMAKKMVETLEENVRRLRKKRQQKRRLLQKKQQQRRQLRKMRLKKK